MHRKPVALRGSMGRNEFAESDFVWFEAAYLPLLGPVGDDIEYVMNVAVYQHRKGEAPN